MRTWKHRLSFINDETKTAVCSTCGPTKVILSKTGKQGWRCLIGKHEKRVKQTSAKTKRRRELCNQILCDICKKEKPLCWDHDHTTGKHRGWLCHFCNVGLGFMLDDRLILYSAIEYLDKTKP